MMMKFLAAVALLGMTAGTAAAQSGVVSQSAGRNALVATAMRNSYTKFEPSKCEAVDKGLHFKVSSGKVYLKTGLETAVDDNKMRALDNGQRVITEAITQNGQSASAGAWYYLGRIYLQQGDVVGADSAFTRALAIAPQCREDVEGYLRNAWIALLNPGIDLMKAQKNDSAAIMFRTANQIFRGGPHAYFYLASMAYEAGDMEKALAYFDSALVTPRDAKNAQVHAQAQYNKAVILVRLNRGADAIAVLRPYVAANPTDVNAKKALMTAFQQAGMPDSAAAVSRQLEAAGVAVQKAAVVKDSPFNQAVALFNEEKYAEAAKLGETAVAAEPNNRDAYYLLTQSYYQTKQGPELVKAGERLIALDPMNERALQMLGFGYGLVKRNKAAIDTRIRLNAMPIALSQVTMVPTPGGVTLTAKATGRNAIDAAGKPLAPAAVTLVFDFVNKDDAVVASQEITVPPRKSAETHDISIAISGQPQGIVSWRYRVK